MAADAKTEELAAVIQAVRDRVRARYPESAAAPGVPLTDLTPVLRARDAALGKVAAIGTVNPRRGGVVNAIVQRGKQLVSRALDWHVREQVEFNRAVVNALDAVLESLNDNNRALMAVAARGDEQVKAAGRRAEELHESVTLDLQQNAYTLNARMGYVEKSLEQRAGEYLEVRDITKHWSEWHVEWERKLTDVESRFLRSVAELYAGFQHRATQMESTFHDKAKTQHSDFMAALWAGVDRVRMELEQTIHSELRIIRQRAAMQPPAPVTAAAPEPLAAIDWLHFGDRFRGTEEYVREKQRWYLPLFVGHEKILDIGCGRGEFLEIAKEAGLEARGIDLSEESVALCRSKGLDAEVADVFAYLESLPDGALDGIFCAQVVEHIPPVRLPEMLRLASQKLVRGGVLAIETPNPQCLAIYASHFYIDPTHRHPVPPPLLDYYLREFGMGETKTHELSPASETMPELNSLPEDFRKAFFGALDYAVISKKL